MRACVRVLCVCVCVRERERESYRLCLISFPWLRFSLVCVTSQAASIGSHCGVITSHAELRLKLSMKYDHDNIRTVHTASRCLAGP